MTTSRARHEHSCNHDDNAHGILILAGREYARGTRVVSLTLANASSVICGPERQLSTDACDCLRERKSRGHLTTRLREIPSPGFTVAESGRNGPMAWPPKLVPEMVVARPVVKWWFPGKGSVYWPPEGSVWEGLAVARTMRCAPAPLAMAMTWTTAA